MNNTEDLILSLSPVAPLPRCGSEPTFEAPWQAQAFALAVALNANGLFTWPEWAECFSTVIREAEPEMGIASQEHYYLHWLTALERISARKGLTDLQALDHRYEAWERATHATPHGEPIELRNDPLWHHS